MPRAFSNGPSRDFVINAYTASIDDATRLHIASPFVTHTEELLNAARTGKRVDLLVGLNSATSPEALRALQQEPNIQVRYYAHRRFHAKIYLFDTAALVGSSNLTDGGLQSNREATVLLMDPDDAATIQELRAVFAELWDYAFVLTPEKLRIFTEAHARYRPATADSLIEAAVGSAEPPNINVKSRQRSAERIFLESLRRQVAEYRNAFNEVVSDLEIAKLHHPQLIGVGVAHEINRFLSFVRRHFAEGAARVKTFETPGNIIY